MRMRKLTHIHDQVNAVEAEPAAAQQSTVRPGCACARGNRFRFGGRTYGLAPLPVLAALVNVARKLHGANHRHASCL